MSIYSCSFTSLAQLILLSVCGSFCYPCDRLPGIVFGDDLIIVVLCFYNNMYCVTARNLYSSQKIHTSLECNKTVATYSVFFSQGTTNIISTSNLDVKVTCNSSDGGEVCNHRMR